MDDQKRKSIKDLNPSDYDFGINSDYVTSFISDSNNFIKKMGSVYSGNNYDDLIQDYSTQVSTYREQAEHLRAYANSRKAIWKEENYNSFIAMLDAYDKNIQTMADAWRTHSETIRQNYKSKEAYENDKYTYTMEDKYGDYNYTAMQKAIADLESKKSDYEARGELDAYKKDLAWLKEYSYTKPYKTQEDYKSAISDAEKQAEDSGAKAFNIVQGKANGWYDNGMTPGDYEKQFKDKKKQISNLKGELKALVLDEYAKEISAQSDFADYIYYDPKKAAGGDKIGLVSEFLFGSRNQQAKQSAEQAGKITMDAIHNPGSDYDKYQAMTEVEKNIFLYLMNKEGKSSAKKYLNDLESVLNKRYTQKYLIPNAKKSAKEHPVLSTTGTVLSSPYKLAGVAEDIANTISGKEIDIYSPAHATTNINSNVRDTVGEMAGNSDWLGGIFQTEVFGTKLGTLLYGAGTSMADMGFDMALSAGLGFGTKGTKALTQFLMSSGAAADGIVEAKNRGLGDWQALSLGLANGLTEWLTEKYSIEAFLGNPKNAVAYLAKNIVSEGLEEANADILNTLADVMIAGDQSKFMQTMTYWEDKGYSKTESFKYAFNDLLQQMGSDALAGAISGAGMGGIGIAGNRIGQSMQQRRTGQEIITNKGQIDTLLKTAQGLDKNSNAYQLAETLAGKASEKISARELGRLAELTTLQMQKEQTGAAITGRLQNLGVAQAQAQQIADVMVKELQGETLNRAEKKALQTQPAQDIYAEIRRGANWMPRADQFTLEARMADNRFTQAAVTARAEELAAAGMPVEEAVLTARLEFIGNANQAPGGAVRMQNGVDGGLETGYTDAIGGGENGREELLYNDRGQAGEQNADTQGRVGAVQEAAGGMEGDLSTRGVETRVLGDRGDSGRVNGAEKIGYTGIARGEENGSGQEIYNRSEWLGRENADTQGRVGGIQENVGNRTEGLNGERSEGQKTFEFSRYSGNYRGVTPQQRENLKTTAVKNADGTPKAVYHFTGNMEFDTFAKGDTGFHFGSEAQAAQRGKDLNQSGRVIAAYLDIQNPVRIDMDIMNWQPNALSLKLYGDGIISENEMYNIGRLVQESGKGYNSPAAVELRRILAVKGYDGVVYQNGFEGEGESYIAFYPEQVIVLDDGRGGAAGKPVLEAAQNSGAAAGVQRIAGTENGSLQVRLTDGQTVDAREVDFRDPQTAELYAAAGEMELNTAGANALVNMYIPQSGTDVYLYARAFKSVYNQALTGLGEADIARLSYSELLNPAQMKAAIAAGQAERQNVFRKSKNASVFTEPSVQQNKALTEKSEKQTNIFDVFTDGQKEVKRIGRALGRTVLFEDTAKATGFKSNGYLDNKGVIHIDYNCADPVRFVFKHELTHFAEGTEAYERFVEAVEGSRAFREWLVDKTGMQGESVTRMEAAYRQAVIESRRNNAPIGVSEAQAEMIADFAGGTLFAADGDLQRLVAGVQENQRNAFVRFIQDFFAYIKEKLTGRRGVSGDIARLERRFSAAVAEATKKNSAGNGGVKYSIVTLDNGQSYVEASRKTIHGNDIAEWRKQITAFFNNLLSESRAIKIETIEGDTLAITKTTAKKARDNYIQENGIRRRMSNNEFLVKLHAESHIDELAELSVIQKNKGTNKNIVPDLKDHAFAKNGFTYRTVYFKDFDGAYYKISLSIGESNGISTVYNVGKLKVDDIPGGNIVSAIGSKADISSTKYSISNSAENVKANAENGSGDTKSTAGQSGRVRYSINPDFEKQYDRWDKTSIGRQFKIGITSDVLQNLGVDKKLIYWDTSKIKKIREKHPNMTHDVVKQVPNILEYPILVMESNTVKGRLTLFGEVYDASGAPVLAVLELNPTDRHGHSLNVIKIASAYGKTTNPQKLIDSSKILYVDTNKNRTERWLSANGLQLPRPSFPYGSINSINQKDSTVNTQSMQNGNKYSIPTEAQELLDRYDNGEISRKDFRTQMTKLWEEAGKEGGTIPKGENAAGDYAVPGQVAKGMPTRRFVRTILETGALTKTMEEQLGAELLTGGFAYEPISNDAAQKYAQRHINDGDAGKLWEDAVNGGRVSKNTVAIGEQMLADAIKAKDNRRVLELSAELSDILTRAGQTVQAARMIKKMTGTGRLLTAQRMIKTLNTDLIAKYGENRALIQLDERIAEQLVNAKTEADMEFAYGEVLQDIADQAPVSWLDKWNAWRYFAMLSNPRTHVRNLVGNAIFIPAVRIKDFIASGMESAAENIGIIDQQQRSKTAFIKKEYLDYAKTDAKNSAVKDLFSGNKYSNQSVIKEKQRVFKTEVLEYMTKRNFAALDWEDTIFKNLHYRHAFAGFLQSRGVNLNHVSESVLWEARAYAVQEAKKATFNDENVMATMLNNLTRIKGTDSTAVKVMRMAAEGVLPFKRTPVNIIRRGIAYSPIGLTKTLTKGLYDVKDGKITATEFIDGISSGLAGSFIMALGMFLSVIGVAVGGFGDDDEDKFEKLNGEQEYAIQMFGKSYTVDWAAPSSIPFFIGVEIVNSVKDSEDFSISKISNVVWNSLEPVTNLSMLSGIQGTIEAAKYADNSETLATIVEDIALSYATQGVPSVLGGAARVIDPVQRTWYTDKNSKVMDKFTQTALNNLKSKIPGLSFTQIPAIDAWGREKTRGNIGERLAENVISPGYYSSIDYDEVETELKRLVKSMGENVYPTIAPKSFEVRGVTKHLTANEYVIYAKAKGQYSYDYISELIKSWPYEKMSDAQRTVVITNLYKYANAKAKTTVSDYDLAKSFKTVTKYEQNGGSAVDYYIDRVLDE